MKENPHKSSFYLVKPQTWEEFWLQIGLSEIPGDKIE